MDQFYIGSIKHNGLSGTEVIGTANIDAIILNSKSVNGIGYVNGDFGYMPLLGLVNDSDVADTFMWNYSTFTGSM